MPYLPDGTYVDDEQYAEMIAQAGGSDILTSGYDLGTNWSFTPTNTGGGSVNLGWEQAPGLGATFNFDPSAGYENAFISDYDISGSGMANVGDVSSPDANLSLTAGLHGTGLNAPDPYIQAAVENVVPGFDVSTGTNIPSSATYSGGNLEDQGYSLDLSKISGGPTEVGFTMGLTPGVNLNLGTAQDGNIGVTASGAWDDIGKTFRQLFSPISKVGAVTEDTSPGFVGPGGLSYPSLEAASQAGAVQSKYGAGGYSGDPLGTGTVAPLPGRVPQAGMAEVPEISIPDRYIEDEKRDWETQEENDARNKEIIRDRKDVMRHLDVVYGTNYSESMVGPVYGDWRGTVLGNLTREQVMNLPDWARDSLLSIHDNVTRTEFLSNFVDTGTTQENIQDIINNKVAIDLRDQGFDYNTALNSMNIATKDSVLAAAQMVEDGTIDLAESLPEMISQVDTFKDIPDVTTPAGPTPAEIAASNAAANALAAANARAKTAANNRAKKAAAAAQRKSDLAAQKAAAAATRELTRLRNLQTAQDKARQKQDAANRAAAKAAAKALLAKAKSGDRGYSDREINAAIEIAHEIDTFGSGGQVDRMGPTGGRGGEGPGGRDHGGGHHGR